MTLDVAEGWSERLAATVGLRVREYRESLSPKLSAQALADATRDAGHELKRTVIANLESGRRGTVSVADVLVLARVLKVPPALLVVPLGAGQPFEVTPGELTDAWSAFAWLTGRWPLAEADREARPAAWGTTVAYEQHDDMLARYRGALSDLARHRKAGDKERVAEAEALAVQWSALLERHRAAMSESSMTPPPLEVELTPDPELAILNRLSAELRNR
jgi:transcriptional regulator with XRE-family HTH domain